MIYDMKFPPTERNKMGMKKLQMSFVMNGSYHVPTTKSILFAVSNDE